MKPTDKHVDKRVLSINGAIERVSRELKRCKEICACNNAPLRSITFRVLDNGNTKLHVTYRRKAKR